MALIQLNWRPGGFDRACDLDRHLASLPHSARLTILVHGYRFDPAEPAHSPHCHILSPSPRPGCWKAVSWPRHLHLGRGQPHAGIAIGWPARTSLRKSAQRALTVGHDLAELLDHLLTLRPDLRPSLFAHSLGARVALATLAHVNRARIDTVILLSGAAYREDARTALANPVSHHTQVFNIRSAENLPFDLAFRLSVPAPRLASLPLSAGLPNAANWTDLRIDCARTRSGLGALGHRIAAPRTTFCHWSGYLRPGLFPLYRRLLDSPDPTFTQALRLVGQRPDRTRRHGETQGLLSPL